MLNLHDRDWKEFYIKDIFFINPGKRLTKTNMIDGNKPFIGATDSNNGVFIARMLRQTCSKYSYGKMGNKACK